jgi:uncharacterized Fe-S cluster protein YjdI
LASVTPGKRVGDAPDAIAPSVSVACGPTVTPEVTPAPRARLLRGGADLSDLRRPGTSIDPGARGSIRSANREEDGMSDERKEYRNGDLVVVWQPARCSHSARCIRGLPGVFDNRRRPWIDLAGASPAEIVAQVGRCPSGALSLGGAATAAAVDESEARGGEAPPPGTASPPPAPPSAAPSAAGPSEGATEVKVAAAGPLLLTGPLRITLPDGATVERAGRTALCRCGASANKPFCDGSHGRVGFSG